MSDIDPGLRSHSLPSVTGAVAALLAASCCILPLLLILSGLAGAGIMKSMMRYEWLQAG